MIFQPSPSHTSGYGLRVAQGLPRSPVALRKNSSSLPGLLLMIEDTKIAFQYWDTLPLLRLAQRAEMSDLVLLILMLKNQQSMHNCFSKIGP